MIPRPLLNTQPKKGTFIFISLDPTDNLLALASLASPALIPIHASSSPSIRPALRSVGVPQLTHYSGAARSPPQGLIDDPPTPTALAPAGRARP